MQPYTPHGDSNAVLVKIFLSVLGCNLIPLTGTVTWTDAQVEQALRGCNLIPLTGTVTPEFEVFMFEHA